MKKFSAALLIALWALYGVACAALPDQDIVILYTNDVHCGVDENIGYAGLAFYRDEIAAGKAARPCASGGTRASPLRGRLPSRKSERPTSRWWTRGMPCRGR